MSHGLRCLPCVVTWRGHLWASNMSKLSFCSVTSFVATQSPASVQLLVLCAVWQEGLLRSVSTTRSSELCLYLLRQANLELSFFSHLELQSFSKSSLPVQTMFPRAAQQQVFSDCSSQSCVLQTCLSWVATSHIFRQTQATRLSILSNACCHMNSFRQCLSLTLECLALQDAPLHSCHGVLQE